MDNNKNDNNVWITMEHAKCQYNLPFFAVVISLTFVIYGTIVRF